MNDNTGKPQRQLIANMPRYQQFLERLLPHIRQHF